MSEDPIPPADRRGAVRTRTLLSGKAIVGDALFSSDCLIVDLSDTGARLRISDSAPLGPPLYLLFVREGRLVEAAVAWRRRGQAGLVFTAEHDLGVDTHPNRRRIRALWSELRPRSGPTGA